jgi:hypothetical protein
MVSENENSRKLYHSEKCASIEVKQTITQNTLLAEISNTLKGIHKTLEGLTLTHMSMLKLMQDDIKLDEINEKG